jgi:hypothetical protein
MKYIITIVRKIFPKESPKPIGRWRLESCNKQMNSKVDLSNEDHCGPCGQYALTKINFKEKQNKGKQNKNPNDSPEFKL